MLKLHLGCGKKILEGWTNCDIADNAYDTQPDVACDITKLPFDDNSADEIMAIHVFEHFYLKDVDGVLAEWKRVLKDGGKLVLEMPCFNKVLHWLRQDKLDPRLTMFPLYGDPGTHKGEHDLHKWCWSMEEIKGLLEGNGFKDVEILEPEYHVKQRDMRVMAINNTREVRA
jgi:predicted SAM-dependent methyltransferase